MLTKILVVDDSLTARKLIIEAIRSNMSIQVIEAQDGKEGLKKLEENPDIRLVFSDINMPWMNGLEMVASIKQNDLLKNIPICILTTETAPESLESAKKLGVNAFLIKPVLENQVVAVVNRFLG